MENAHSHFKDLVDNVREYIETRILITKMDTADAGASVVSNLITWMVIAIGSTIMVLMLSIGAGFLIGYYVNNLAFGFLIVAGVYLLIIALLAINRDQWIKKPIRNKLIKSIYENN